MPQLLQFTLFSKYIYNMTPEQLIWTSRVRFFSVNTVSPSYSLVFTSQIQPTMDQKQYFWFVNAKRWLYVLFYMYYSTPFYVRYLNTGRFWYLQGVLEWLPHRYQGLAVVKFLGSQKLYADFQVSGGWCPSLPHCPRVDFRYLPNT